MNIDQRLHRAVHDLREIEIEVPPLDVGSATQRGPLRRLGAPAATVVLFALGVLVASADVMPSATDGRQVASPVEITLTDDRQPASASGDAAVPQLSALEELAMISALQQRDSTSEESAALDPSIPPRAS